MIISGMKFIHFFGMLSVKNESYLFWYEIRTVVFAVKIRNIYLVDIHVATSFPGVINQLHMYSN